ncbi:hypothetical protein ACFLZB_00835 [Nanoarchaeota archaeon]
MAFRSSTKKSKEDLFEEIKRRLMKGQNSVSVSLDETICGRSGDFEHNFYGDIGRKTKRGYFLDVCSDGSRYSELLEYFSNQLSPELLAQGIQTSNLKDNQFKARVFKVPSGPKNGLYAYEDAFQILNITEEEFAERFPGMYEDTSKTRILSPLYMERINYHLGNKVSTLAQGYLAWKQEQTQPTNPKPI